ncbi:MAG: FKBP-type peptidyl-prolyl cis-trans isomerase [Bacteroidales bacterium]|nr:FKBP-type peptidyl-prolyl cis-trans isomerase [Bacteroidales bacterium]
MKNTFSSILCVIAAIVMTGCAKTVSSGPNEANKRYFDAWLSLNYPNAEKAGRGIYIIEETEGTGDEVTEDGYVVLDYVATDLEGTISAYTDSETARQLGEYAVTTYYGPTVWTTFEGTIQAGLMDALEGMKAGGSKKVIIPSWLMSYKAYDTEEQYLDASSSYSDAIYDITVKAFTDSINVYEIEQIKKYISDNPETFNDRMTNDTTGFYYQPVSEDIDTEDTFPSDTTIYINYTGKLLNGLVFDTTMEKVAKDNGLYSSSKTYEPVQINWGESYSDITMGSDESSIISGFALTLWQMHPMEKGIGVFYSPLGYGYSGSGSSIPAYAPLIFEIEIVEEPED